MDGRQMWTGLWFRFRRYQKCCCDDACMYATAVCVYIDWCSRGNVWLLLQSPDLLARRKKKELTFLTHEAESALFHDSSGSDFIGFLLINFSPLKFSRHHKSLACQS